MGGGAEVARYMGRKFKICHLSVEAGAVLFFPFSLIGTVRGFYVCMRRFLPRRTAIIFPLARLPVFISVLEKEERQLSIAHPTQRSSYNTILRRALA